MERPALPNEQYSESETAYVDLMQKCWMADPVKSPLFDDIATILLYQK
jgi:hypothetical protein